MGTWARQKDKIPEVIQELEDFKKRIFNIVGDDYLFDRFDEAIKRLEELANAPEPAEIALAEALMQGYGIDGGIEEAAKRVALWGRKFKIPLQEAVKIQEALIPLGYAVQKFEEDQNGGIMLRLSPLVEAAFREN